MSYRKARTQHDKIKLMTYIQYMQQSWRKKKEKNKKNINVYELHNTSVLNGHYSMLSYNLFSCFYYTNFRFCKLY